MWAEYGAFVLKTITLVVILVIGLVAVARASQGSSGGSKKSGGRLQIEKLNDRLEAGADRVRQVVMSKKAYKSHHKSLKAERKAAAEKETSQVWVLRFKGDMHASQVDNLRREVTAIIQVANATDEVVVVLESPGGAVSGYGLAASQLVRVKEAGLSLTVCVDKVAASGGYMMACIADRIIAAPFAVVGSIGVLAQVPNIHKLLQRHQVDVEVLTAGKHKAPMTLMGEKTEEGRQKLLDDLKAIHERFKELVGRYRPQLDLAAVTEGDFWLAEDARELGLVDQLETSDAYLLGKVKTNDVVSVTWVPQVGVDQRLKKAFSSSVQGAVDSLSQRYIP
ncbi:protease SohB [Saccharospirillum impatiens]|uniref:protease SohB n=1 Tax=Saccharospirillum impatiens TaxID=169438 RepID=UPI00042552AB|nr:protease SohB [Saccharospirillum impatiens]